MSLVRRLTADGRRHPVFVRYDANFPVDFEWVYNGADLSEASIVSAHDLGSEKNEELRARLPGRQAWWFVSSGRAPLLKRTGESGRAAQ